MSVDYLVPAGVAETSCTIDTLNATTTTVLSAATGATVATSGTATCVVLNATATGARALQGGAACSTSSLVKVSYLVPVIVPVGGSSTAAVTAIAALGPNAFATSTTTLVTATGCPASAFTCAGANVTAVACGSAAVAAEKCALPSPSVAPAPAAVATALDVGAVIGGVIGGVVIILLLVAVSFYVRRMCYPPLAAVKARTDKDEEEPAGDASSPGLKVRVPEAAVVPV